MSFFNIFFKYSGYTYFINISSVQYNFNKISNEYMELDLEGLSLYFILIKSISHTNKFYILMLILMLNSLKIPEDEDDMPIFDDQYENLKPFFIFYLKNLY